MSQELFDNQVNSDRRIMGIPIVGSPSLTLNSLQFDSVNNTFIWVAGASGAGMGDLEFLRDKQLAGDLVDVTAVGTLAGPITVLAITPAAGKTLFMSDGQMIITNASGAGTGFVVGYFNGPTLKQTLQGSLLDDTMVNDPLRLKGDSLVGNGVLTYSVVKSAGVANVDVSAFLQGWIQDT